MTTHERLEFLARHYAQGLRPFLLHGGSAAERATFAAAIHAHSGLATPLHTLEGTDPALAAVPQGEHVFLTEVEALSEAAQAELLAGIRAERWRLIAGTQGEEPDRLSEELYALLEAGYVAVSAPEPVAV
ncbi:MAG: hypothetical protein R3F62_08230 [Planctomycetota bacterium]